MQSPVTGPGCYARESLQFLSAPLAAGAEKELWDLRVNSVSIQAVFSREASCLYRPGASAVDPD